MIVRKSPREIDKMRAAGRLCAETLALAAKMVEPGITLRQIDVAAERFMCSRGGIPTFKGYRGFPATLCTSVNEQVVHGIPGDRVLKSGDILSIDCGVTLDGFIGDSAITLPIGDVAPALQQLLRVTEQSLYRGIEAATVGNRLFDISAAVERTVMPFGYGIVQNYCGHGVGRQLHEEPQIPNYGRPGTGPRLKAGWCLAIEPMVNLGTHENITLSDGWTVVTTDGRHSAHFEHSIAVTENEPLILTDRRDL